MRTLVAVAVACSLFVGLSRAEDVQASMRKPVSIAGQELGSALREFAKEQELYLVFMSSDLGTRQTAGLVGEFTRDEALQKLLEGSGLTFHYIDEKTVSIVPIATAPAVENEEDTALADKEARDVRSFWDRFRVAQAETSTSGVKEEGESAQLEEIVVTAQKRTERLLDVPISISVLTGQDLDRSTVEGVSEALSRVPGVTTTPSYGSIGSGMQVAIRGVAANEPIFGGASPVAYYLDSSPFGLATSSIGPDANAYDMERVEVLRGPQGTLYGASALNGVVRVLTKDADLNDFELKARSVISTTDNGAGNYKGDVAINLPIVEGKLAARAVAGYADMSGWINRLNANNVNDAQLRNFRLKVNAEPTEELSLGFSAWSSRSNYGGPSAANDEGLRGNLLEEAQVVDYDVYGLKMGYKLPWFSVSSVTSYLDYYTRGLFDLSFAGLPDNPLTSTLESTTFSEEIILNSLTDREWRWSLGGIYRNAKDSQHQVWPGINVVPLELEFRSESYAVFGELTRSFADTNLELTAGLRYFEDRVTQDQASDPTGAPPPGVFSRQDYSATTPRVVLNWRPNTHLTAYASYSEGFRSGQDQTRVVLSIAPELDPAEPDSLRNYELGAKGALWGGRLAFDAAVYFMDWIDIQQSIFVRIRPGVDTFATINGQSASGVGFDFGLTTEPLERLTLGFNGSWNNLEMDADVVSGAGTSQEVVVFNKGDRLNFSAESTLGAFADYVFALGTSGLKGTMALSANYTTKLGYRTIGGPVENGDPMTITRASFGISSANRWTTSLFVDNLGNEQGIVSTTSRLSFPDQNVRLRPRTIGAQVDFRF